MYFDVLFGQSQDDVFDEDFTSKEALSHHLPIEALQEAMQQLQQHKSKIPKEKVFVKLDADVESRIQSNHLKPKQHPGLRKGCGDCGTD